jgi:MFS family permease
MAIIWPQMVAVLYTDDGGASMYAAWLSCAPSVMINFGQIVAGFLAEPIGKTKLQCISVLVIGGALLGGESLVLRVTLVEQIC